MPFCRFPNLGILHVTRKRVVDVLTERFIQNKAMQITMQGGDPVSQLGEGRGREASGHFVPVSCEWCLQWFRGFLSTVHVSTRFWNGRFSLAIQGPKSNEPLVCFQDCIDVNGGNVHCSRDKTL